MEWGVTYIAGIPEVDLEADEDLGDLGAEVLDLGGPLLRDVVQRVRVVNRVADDDDVAVRVTQRPESTHTHTKISTLL